MTRRRSLKTVKMLVHILVSVDRAPGTVVLLSAEGPRKRVGADPGALLVSCRSRLNG